MEDSFYPRVVTRDQNAARSLDEIPQRPQNGAFGKLDCRTSRYFEFGIRGIRGGKVAEMVKAA